MVAFLHIALMSKSQEASRIEWSMPVDKPFLRKPWGHGESCALIRHGQGSVGRRTCLRSGYQSPVAPEAFTNFLDYPVIEEDDI